MSMKRLFLLLPLSLGALFMAPNVMMADETVTVTATNADISENLDLKMVATLFGQAKDLATFEQMLNNPDSAFSNLDLNGDGDVDYLRVVETADQNRHLIVIQAVLAKDIYQDVASIFVEKDPESESVTVQVIGDEYIYGENYIIEPVYIYRPMIYDWFWGPSWVCWHSPYYWGYWPGWWHPYHCIAHHLYWDHCYWHHHYYPICTYRTGHHYHAYYKPMHRTVSRTDYATRHPERSFSTRNASRNYSNARDIDRGRITAMRNTTTSRSTATGNTRVSSRSTSARTFGSANVRTNGRIGNSATRVENTGMRTTQRNASTAQTATRSQSVTTRTSSTPTRSSSVTTSPRRSSNTVATPTRSSSTVNRTSTVPSTTRSSSPTVNRSSSSSMRTSSSSSVRSSGGGSTMRSGGMSSGAGSMRSSGGGSSRGGGSTTRR